MRSPALAVSGVDEALLLAVADDYGPTAAEDAPDGCRLFFPDATHRDQARDAILGAWPDAVVVALEVDDEDWARRSQEGLAPITVGRLTILPAPPGLPDLPGLPALPGLVIVPSTGFGTGHHPTTRLCLEALQELDLTGRSLLDVGTGSGILAIAGRLLGARLAIGIDNDADAVRSAMDNLAINTGVSGVEFRVNDLSAPAGLPASDVVTANLTGTLLRRAAPLLLGAVQPGGFLIVSGLLASEHDDVAEALGAVHPVWEAAEDEWVALMFSFPLTHRSR